jgi:hypothetical protein
MHGILLALTLAAYLLTPSSHLTWDLAGPAKAPASRALEKEGPGLDPFGLTANAPTTEAGPGWDPDGHS